MNTEKLLESFKQGTAYNAHSYYGAHVEKKGVVFRTYAPRADHVNIFGEFNNWQEEPMERQEDGTFTFRSKEAKPGMMYKYVIYGWNGYRMEHSDPYGYGVELRPGSASIIVELDGFEYTDQKWMETRTLNYDQPLSIYELHLGSWKKNPKEEHGWYTYRELAKPLISYVKKSGYTHIEVMPLTEYPYDGSWGYQVTGFFAPTSRYGTDKDLKYLINECHKAGIGVIMDFVPVHFAIDDFGLKNYDSTALYEYYQGGDSQWGSCMFNHNRKEVCSFLISAAHYWLEEYHFDGLRIDAVSNLIYVNGSQDQGENKAGQEFIRNLNTIIRKLHPTAMLFAEDSSPWQGGVTKPVKEGGLGFDYKWNMGWMYDTLYFLGLPVQQRMEQYHKMTFSMWYFYNERYLLSLSHDEVVNGANTILEKIPGEDAEKFAQLRVYYMYMYIHPGKKLNFMGNELGERVEWNEGRGLSWELLEEPAHKTFYDYLCVLQKLYSSNDAFFAHELDTNQFQWLYCKQETEPVYVMMRTGKKESYVAVLNFGDHVVEDFELVLDKKQTWKLILDSGWKKYGGELPESKEELKTVERIKKSEEPEGARTESEDGASQKKAADKAEASMQDGKAKKAVKQVKEHVLKISLPSYSGKLYQII